MSANLTLRDFQAINRERCEAWHPGGIEDWSPAEWGNAFAGEAGELCNVLKKILRHDKGIHQLEVEAGRGYHNPAVRQELLREAADEICDAYCYLDLVASRLGLDMQQCVVDKFNRISDREKLSVRIPVAYTGPERYLD